MLDLDLATWILVMEKRPRHYATDVLRIENLEDRRQFIENDVPERYRETVKEYVRQWWHKREEVLKNVERRIQARRQSK